MPWHKKDSSAASTGENFFQVFVDGAAAACSARPEPAAARVPPPPAPYQEAADSAAPNRNAAGSAAGKDTDRIPTPIGRNSSMRSRRGEGKSTSTTSPPGPVRNLDSATAGGGPTSPPETKKKSANAEIEAQLGRVDMARILGPGTRDLCMLSPVSRIRLSWDFCAFSALLLDLWIAPMQLVFLQDEAVPPSFMILSAIITGFFVMDVLVNFNTGYIDRDKLVLQRVPSIKKYMACWFWVDLVSTLPFDTIISAVLSNFTGDVLSMTRLARLTKVTKVLKTLRFLKMLRAIRLLQQMGRADEFIEMYAPIKYFFRLVQILVAVAFVAHVHGCTYALLQPELMNLANVDVALGNYYYCFRWAYNALTIGHMGEPVEDTPGVWTLEMVIASERILVAILVGGWGIVKALTMFQEDAQLTLVKNAAVRFFRQHSVSIETQISVMYSLHETREAQKMQRHFKSLMSEHLPDELRRTVSEELWVPQLMTLGLISQLSAWNEDFVAELSLIVREEVVASKTVLCKEGHASIAAYYILKGHLLVTSSRTHSGLTDFTEGMWVEETALVSPVRRRASTIVIPQLCRLMAVPTQAFHELITSLGLDTKFQEFRESVLARGLCGRCGDVGDHFTHACPLVFNHHNRSHHKKGKKRSLKGRVFTEQEGSVSLDAFLHAHRLNILAPILQEKNIETRADLEDLDFDEIEQQLVGRPDLLKALSLLHDLVMEQQEAAALQQADQLEAAQHLAFLSHYKLESGTEAALMRAELERVLMEDPESPSRSFTVPVFLDSEDLSDLEELEEHVRKSHNLVLLLTKDVLLRPWVIVEIVTAVETDVRVMPVEVNKKGSTFVYPDEDYYARLVAGQVLDEAGQALLRERGITLHDVEKSLREVFNKIALPYSPHRSETIRMAEVRAIQKQLLYRGAHDYNNR